MGRTTDPAPGSTKPMNEVEIAWLAGIIDGEGWFDCMEKEGRIPAVRIGVESIDLDLLQQCHSFSGMGIVSGPRFRGEDRKPIWTWRVGKRRDVFRLLLAIAPLLSNRRRARILEIVNKYQHVIMVSGLPPFGSDSSTN